MIFFMLLCVLFFLLATVSLSLLRRYSAVLKRYDGERLEWLRNKRALEQRLRDAHQRELVVTKELEHAQWAI